MRNNDLENKIMMLTSENDRVQMILGEKDRENDLLRAKLSTI